MSYNFEQMIFAPKWYHYPVIVLFSPLAFCYAIFMFFRRQLTTKKNFDIPIISVGNLIVGGSGKTPFVIEIASRYTDVFVISRGYGRKSKGLVEVSYKGNILVDVEQSGDEAMLMAISLDEASVVVSEDRKKAINFAKQKGAKLIVLDDGFSRVDIEKFELILEPEFIKNYLPLPVGAFREFFFSKKYADVVAKEGINFVREVSFENLKPRMLLVTAISNPKRLDKYLPEGIVQKVYLQDHQYFDEDEIKKLFIDCDADSILCTSKDKVKMQKFTLPISEMKLKLKIDNAIMQKIEDYIRGSSSKEVDR